MNALNQIEIQQEFYTIDVLDEPGTFLINGEHCRICHEDEVVLIDNLTLSQQFSAYAWIFENEPSETIFPRGFWQPYDRMCRVHGRWFNLNTIKLGYHPLALFAWYLERNQITPQMIDAGQFNLDYPF